MFFCATQRYFHCTEKGTEPLATVVLDVVLQDESCWTTLTGVRPCYINLTRYFCLFTDTNDTILSIAATEATVLFPHCSVLFACYYNKLLSVDVITSSLSMGYLN